MGIFGHMRIHNSGIHRNADNTDTSFTPSVPAILTTTATPTTMNDIARASTDFSCPHCARNFNSRIGLVGHLRIHRREAGKPVPGAPTYSRRTGLHCPHCFRTFTHRMGLSHEAKPHQRTQSTLIQTQHPHNHHNVPYALHQTKPSAQCMCCVYRVADQLTVSQTAMAHPYPLGK
ncbi:unnamed protein product [Schistocephalus solidus]|uniref:C2H2-type domain-containing protein n=1 Tax=Schistocephalus solidus TaxID=70667 RepID=A0A183TFW3_SCHSO|nr:unnamed protein product [Schistocephalus solidus]